MRVIYMFLLIFTHVCSGLIVRAGSGFEVANHLMLKEGNRKRALTTSLDASRGVRPKAGFALVLGAWSDILRHDPLAGSCMVEDYLKRGPTATEFAAEGAGFAGP